VNPNGSLLRFAQIKEDENGKKSATKLSLGKWCAKSHWYDERLIETDDVSFVMLFIRDGRYILSVRDFF
jgi:hypothetical protein